MERPFNRFFSDNVSYIEFLLLIVIDVMLTVYEQDEEVAVRMPSAVQWLIVFWVIGKTWHYSRVLYHKRTQVDMQRFAQALEDGSALWHFFDLFMLLFFWLYVILCFTGAAIHWSEREELHRIDLDEFDPILWSESAYVVAVILAFARLNSLLWVSNGLGPLLISLTRMFWDIFLFLLLFSIWMVAFVVGVTKLYAPYKMYLDKEETSAAQYGRWVCYTLSGNRTENGLQRLNDGLVTSSVSEWPLCYLKTVQRNHILSPYF